MYKHMHAKNALLVDFEDRYQMCRLNFLPLDPAHHSQPQAQRRRGKVGVWVCMYKCVQAMGCADADSSPACLPACLPDTQHILRGQHPQPLLLTPPAPVRAHRRGGGAPPPGGAAHARQGGAAGTGGGGLSPAAGGAAGQGARDGQGACLPLCVCFLSCERKSRWSGSKGPKVGWSLLARLSFSLLHTK